MVKAAIIGKTFIIEKISWCKKFSDYKQGEEKQKDAQIELNVCSDVMIAATDPSLDTYHLTPKLVQFGLTFPTADELGVLTQALFKQIQTFILFQKLELIPGRPDYEYGIGLSLETKPIFFEDKIYKLVDVVKKEKSMGGLMSKDVKVTQREVKKMWEILGKEFNSELDLMTILKFEKDNRDNKRFSARATHNTSFAFPQMPMANKLDNKWKDAASFFQNVAKSMKILELMINRIYTTIGYDNPPDFTILMGELDPDRKPVDIKKEDVEGVPVLDVVYG